ncbi:MAG TPA: hypothetical protein VES20_06465 [Bryobacteraceae bacterium]|nr:hypothetical protein [Bryobacteraceae bacterium]
MTGLDTPHPSRLEDKATLESDLSAVLEAEMGWGVDSALPGLPICPDKLIPAGALAAFRRRLDTVTAQNVPDGLIGDFAVKTFQCPDDPVVAPGPIFSGESDDQRLQLGTDTLTSGV